MDTAVPMNQSGSAMLPPLLAGGVPTASKPAPQPPPIIRFARPSRSSRSFWTRAGFAVIIVLFCVPILCAIGIASYFRLSSATRALQSSVMESVPGQWDKHFAVNIGGFTMFLARYGSSFFNLPPEPKAALGAVRGAEVGVYELRGKPSALDYRATFAATDKSMKRRGWERIVGVADHGQFVAVYMPRNVNSLSRLSCCVVVLDQRNLVVAAVRGNAEPLLNLAMQRKPLLSHAKVVQSDDAGI